MTIIFNYFNLNITESLDIFFQSGKHFLHWCEWGLSPYLEGLYTFRRLRLLEMVTVIKDSTLNMTF